MLRSLRDPLTKSGIPAIQGCVAKIVDCQSLVLNYSEFPQKHLKHGTKLLSFWLDFEFLNIVQDETL